MQICECADLERCCVDRQSILSRFVAGFLFLMYGSQYRKISGDTKKPGRKKRGAGSRI
jgi:hypothetical protein